MSESVVEVSGQGNGQGSAFPFNFITDSVPRYHYTDSEGLERIRNQLPVILTGSDLVLPAYKWDFDYLQKNLGPGPFTVFSNHSSPPVPDLSGSGETLIKKPKNTQTSDSSESQINSASGSNSNGSHKHSAKPVKKRNTYFKYYDEKKVDAFKGEFKSDITRMEISFDELLKRFHGNRSEERVYFQQSLNSTVGKQIALDFVAFNWKWAIERQRDCNWGPLTSNLLLIGQAGNVTPCHYDEQENLFCQINGTKTFLLFSPDYYASLYPYPVHHPHDRQSQVELEEPDFERFPKLRDLRGVEATLQRGDILYVPMYWWHHVINVTDTIAINFWYKGGSDTPIVYPLKARQKVAIVRNVEKMLLEALQSQDEVGNVLHWLVDGRF